jgi:hypothetical protein
VLAGFALALAPGGDFNKEGRGDGDVPLVALMYQRLTGDDGGLRPRSAVEKLRAFLISDEAKLLTRGTDRGLAELVLQAVFLEMHKRTVNTLEPSLEGAEYFRGLQRERVERIAALFRLPGDEAAGDAAEGGAARRHVS